MDRFERREMEGRIRSATILTSIQNRPAMIGAVAQPTAAASSIEDNLLVQMAMEMRDAAGQSTAKQEATNPLLAAADELRRQHERISR